MKAFLTFVTALLFSQIQLWAVTETLSEVQGSPGIWKVDVYAEIQKIFPSIRQKRIILVRAEENDHAWVARISREKKWGVKSVDVERNSQSVTFSAKGEELRPDDRVVINYNQKILVYIPEQNMSVWIQPVRKNLRLRPVENSHIERSQLNALADQHLEIPQPKQPGILERAKKIFRKAQ